MVFYLLCETFNKNQFVLNFVVCIVLLAMDFWTVSSQHSSTAGHLNVVSQFNSRRRQSHDVILRHVCYIFALLQLVW